MATGDGGVVVAAITVSAALRLSARSRRWTIECCFPLNVAGSISASRCTMPSAVSWGSAAGQLSIVAELPRQACKVRVNSLKGRSQAWRRAHICRRAIVTEPSDQ
jgi:hypothetical protein